MNPQNHSELTPVGPVGSVRRNLRLSVIRWMHLPWALMLFRSVLIYVAVVAFLPSVTFRGSLSDIIVALPAVFSFLKPLFRRLPRASHHSVMGNRSA